jgi:O-antigen/teichoic acid export membrane protein
MPISENNKRIAKNTMTLYIRMLITMIISLYTSRIVLNTLGVRDFGIYSVVGGIVFMFSFLNGSMESATHRFLSFEIGRGNFLHLKKVFSFSVTTHIGIAVVIFILAETIGLWFLNAKMNIPFDQMDAARWVYQFSIFSCAISVVQTPYRAIIIANEKMSIYAYISILEAILKLLVVFMLAYLSFNKLQLYAVLTFSITLLISLIYRIYCKKKYQECSYSFFLTKHYIKILRVSRGGEYLEAWRGLPSLKD